MAATKMTKNQMRRAKKKEEKKKAKAASETPEPTASNGTAQEKPKDDTPPPEPSSDSLEVRKDASAADKIPADGPVDLDDVAPEFEAMYRDILTKFSIPLDEDGVPKDANNREKGQVFYDEDNEIPSEDEEANGETKLSKKKRKKLNKLSIAELKALVANPEVVEWQDVSSSDPRLLVQIKAQRNIVPVPGHWSLKREYLSSKRGIEKPPFRLPKFIAETGITEMRDAVLEKQAEQTLKQKQRERVAPKMGKLDIDYQKLYDAFFRFQEKPPLTRFGDVYHEGKEFEADYRHFKPGELSDALKEALGMQPGFPPPWLLQQQRMGPPPSYPTLKIPGLNAPIPPGASWGFAPGQWGKPPLDEYNRPIYGGDIFGIMAANPGAAQSQQQTATQQPSGEPVERTVWGELQPPQDESEEEESDEEEEEEDEDRDVPGGLETPSGLETPGGYSTVPVDGPSGVESSIGEFDLRKQRRGFETEESAAGPRSAYTVVPERQTQATGFFGSDRVYDLSKARGAAGGPPVLGQDEDGGRKRKKPGDVDVALDPDALASHDGISRDELRRKFEEGRKEEGVGAKWQYDEDLSEMIAQESRKRQKVEEDRRRGGGGGGGGGEKKKETKYRF